MNKLKNWRFKLNTYWLDRRMIYLLQWSLIRLVVWLRQLNRIGYLTKSVRCLRVARYRFQLVWFDSHPVHYSTVDAFGLRSRHHLFILQKQIEVMLDACVLSSISFIFKFEYKPSSPDE